jgi:hypothetical protein
VVALVPSTCFSDQHRPHRALWAARKAGLLQGHVIRCGDHEWGLAFAELSQVYGIGLPSGAGDASQDGRTRHKPMPVHQRDAGA